MNDSNEESINEFNQKAIFDCWNRNGVWGAEVPRCEKLDEIFHCRNCDVFSLASRQMLDRKLPGGYLENWASVYSLMKTSANKETRSVLVFRLGDEWLALHTQLINEVAEMAPIHRIPHQNSYLIRGLVNIRGELKICISIGSILCLERSTKYASKVQRNVYERMIVVSHEEHDFVFPVSEVVGIHRYHPQDVENIPTTVSKSKATYTSGIIVINDSEADNDNGNKKKVAFLDHQLLFYFLERSMS